MCVCVSRFERDKLETSYSKSAIAAITFDLWRRLADKAKLRHFRLYEKTHKMSNIMETVHDRANIAINNY